MLKNKLMEYLLYKKKAHSYANIVFLTSHEELIEIIAKI